ncbi:protein timeless homolog isoform X1 [Anopheles stephensi]|uniref:protein timeless homolog isoform X1 n=1 Tax=Anopheles stephensi TaxID=30069 RepID=UPI00165895D9|nr:protein timeless homolog isoform X1 [Anopheles stephensi]
MSAYFADIDAVCSTLGWMDGDVYRMDPEAVQGLKHLIWILKQDKPSHECRRYIGGKRIVQTDLIPMVISNFDKPDVVDVLLRLLVNLSFPTLLLYNGNYPRDAVEQRKFIRLIEICEEYKEAFSLKSFWSVLGDRLEKILHTDWALRSEADGLIIERILALTRNVLQVPANVEREKRFDNDASQHDCLLWALHQAGILDILLYILGSPHENRFLIHTLEILSLAYREQSAIHLADATLQRTNIEKKTDELMLIKARQPPAAVAAARKKPTSMRHSWFRGTYTYNNLKSVSDSDAVCHQALGKIMRMEFSAEKHRQKVSFRQAKETETLERKSIFSVRLFLREYCMEILRVYNNMVRQARRHLDQHGTSVSEYHDDSYLLWTIRFFLEFNRHCGFKIELVSESLSTDTFHWTITRMETYTENIVSDKTRKSIWARRLHLTVQTYRELLNNMYALAKTNDPNASELLSVLQNNIFYVVEYRETTIHLLTNFKESVHTRAFLRDVVEVAHLFFSMLQRFCKGTVRVQQRVKAKRKKTTKKQTRKEKSAEKQVRVIIVNLERGASANPFQMQEDAEIRWLQEAPTVAALLENSELKQEELPTPFDAASSVPVDEQKGECVKRIHALLRDKQYEQAIKMLYAARSVWTMDDCFGSETASPDEDLLTLRDIFTANLSSGTDREDNDEGDIENESDDEEEEAERQVHSAEKDFKFEDFSKRLVDHRVVYACTTVLADWEKIKTSCLKAAVTLLYRICVEHKMPSMLFQISLLRVFQGVLNAPEDDHARELRRLAIHTVRQLQQKVLSGAPDDGGLLFAELLFAKSTRIAGAIEMGYDEVFGEADRRTAASKKAWTEEQEAELHRLFMENQENPSSDQDVIDWLLENLIDQTRTRRGVMKKLKEMGLVFKAPTKRSNANQKQKGAWTAEEDAKLGVLYEELRLDKNPLKSIAEGFEKKFTKPAIARRMVSLGLIADVSEIMATKRRNNERRGDSSDDAISSNSSPENEDSEEEEEASDRAGRGNVSGIQRLSEQDVKKHLKTLGSEMKEAVRWLITCFKDALDLYDDSDPSEDNDGGIPIVPIAPHQTAALEKSEFKRLLRSLGVMSNGKQHVYHRIPFKLTPAALEKRIQLLTEYCAKEDGADSDALEKEEISSSVQKHSADELDTTVQKKTSKAIFSDSSDSDQSDRKQEKASRKKPAQRKPKQRQPENERRSMSPLVVSEEDDPAAEPSASERTESNRALVAPSDGESNEAPLPKASRAISSKRNRSIDSSGSEADLPMVHRRKRVNHSERRSLSPLVVSGEEDETTATPKQSVSRLVVSDDESDTEVPKEAMNDDPVPAKRNRSDSVSEERPTAQKARRRAVISSDEED